MGGWGGSLLSVCFAHGCVSDHFWHTTEKPPLRCADLSSLSASSLQGCLSSPSSARGGSCPCIQHKDAEMFAPSLSSFFFPPPKSSSLHKGLVNPFKYAQQTQKCVMLTATLVTYNIFFPSRCLQKLLRQVTSPPVLRGGGGLCAKNMISDPHWDYFWHTTKSLHFAVLIYLHWFVFPVCKYQFVVVCVFP